MACEKPNVSVVVPGLSRNGKPNRKFLGAATNVFSGEQLHQKVGEHVSLIPCGQCAGCRLDKSKEWAIRILYETRNHETSTFLTLTYDEKHVPDSISGPRITTFIKDLRARLDYKQKTKQIKEEHAKIKFFAVGEYGEKKGRPHYHAILFGGPFGRESTGSNQTRPARTNSWLLPH